MVFAPVLGGTKEMGDVSIGLVVDRVEPGAADVIEPANRLPVEGIPVFDYHVYPAANAVADKVCATLQTYPGNRPSSRVRDLVDLAVYATTVPIDGDALSARLALEARLRRLGALKGFDVPDSWHAQLSRSFEKSAREANLPDGLREVGAAEGLVKKCVEPAIAGETEGLVWNPEALAWL